MTVSKERKAELTAQFGNSPVDTGNPKVQVAILSERIKELTEHMKSHQKDFHTRRGLLMLVGRRRRLLSYIKKNDIVEYRELIKALASATTSSNGFVHAKSVLRSGALFLCKGVNNHALKRGGGRGPASHEKPAGKGPVG